MDLLIINSLKAVQPVMINDRYLDDVLLDMFPRSTSPFFSADTVLSATDTIF